MVTALLFGEVDHGKSSLIGRLLFELGAMTDLQERRLQSLPEERNFALLLDALGEERADERTVGLTRVTLRRGERSVRVLDTPGHLEFMRSLVTGLSLAQIVVVVVSAPEGVSETLKRQLSLLQFFAPQRLFLAMTKGDLVDSPSLRLAEIAAELTAFHFDGIYSLSARTGLGLSSGEGFIEALFAPLEELPVKDFRMWVQGVVGDSSFGTPSEGSVSRGEKIWVAGAGSLAEVKSIASLEGDVASIRRGSPATLKLEPSEGVSRGALLGIGGLPKLTDSLQLVVQQFDEGRFEGQVRLRFGTRAEIAEIAEIQSLGAVSNIRLSLSQPIPVDTQVGSTNRFLLEEHGRALAIGRAI